MVSTARILKPSHQFKHRNFRPGTDTDGDNGGSDAAIDIELAAGFFVPSANVRRLDPGEGEATAEELKRQLAPVSMPHQNQVKAELNCTFKIVANIVDQ